jgi:hypothetical protein
MGEWNVFSFFFLFESTTKPNKEHKIDEDYLVLISSVHEVGDSTVPSYLCEHERKKERKTCKFAIEKNWIAFSK